jgi:hypothetical protein
MASSYAEIPVGLINSVNITYTLAFAPNPVQSLQLFLNGLLQENGTDYNITGAGQTITFINGVIPQTGDILIAYYTYVAAAAPGAGTFTELTGSDLIQMMTDRMGGYANAMTADVMLDLLNEGKDKLWTILKMLNESFFHTSSQSTDPTKVNYFGSFVTTAREYQLPGDFRAIRFIECTTAGFASARFVKKRMTDPDWQFARRNANDPTVNAVGTAQFEFYYDIVESQNGGFELVFAQNFAAPLQCTLWYIRGIPDFEAGDSINQIIRPYSKAIVTFAVKKAMCILQDESLSALWEQDWRKDIIDTSQGSSPINQADPIFVVDFEG